MTQTFLPYPDFEKCAKVLDNKRLNSTIGEGYEAYIYNLGNPTRKVLRHPHGHCVNRLWEGHEQLLRVYLMALIREAKSRGMQPMDTEWFTHAEPIDCCKPIWLGCEIFHILYQRHLLSKDFEYYKKYFSPEFAIAGYLAPLQGQGWKVYSSQYDKNADKLIVSTFLRQSSVSTISLLADV